MPNHSDPDSKHHTPALYVVLAAGLYLLITAFRTLAPILLSALLIMLISLAVNPVILWMQAWIGGRKAATAAILLALVIIVGLTGWAFFVPMKASVARLWENLPAYWDQIQKPLIKMEKQAVLSEERLQEEVSTEIAREEATAGELDTAPTVSSSTPPETAKTSGPIRSRLGQMAEGVFGRFASAAFNTAQILIVLVTVFFGVTYTLMNPRPIFAAVFSLVSERHHAKTLTIVQRIGAFVPAWAASTLLGMLTIGLLVFLLMWPILGFMDALVLGLIAGVMEAVPVVGPLLSAVPGILLALGKGGLTPLWVLLAYVLVQALEGNVILPIIIARGMNLHPLAVIFSTLLCVTAFGVLGVLIAAPLVAIVDILHDELYRKRVLPDVTDADLQRLAREALHEKMASKATAHGVKSSGKEKSHASTK